MEKTSAPGRVGKDCLCPELYTDAGLYGGVSFTIWSVERFYPLTKWQGGKFVQTLNTMCAWKEYPLNIRFVVPVLLGFLLLLSLGACDKGKTAGNEDDTTWTWDRCTTEGWDTTDNTWHICDSLLFLDVRAACEWEEGAYYDSLHAEEERNWRENRQYWRGLKKLSPRIKEIYFNYYFHFEEAPNLTEFPPEIWEIPNLREIGFYKLPKLKGFPPITKPNKIQDFQARYVSVPFPKGLKNTKIDRITWSLSKLDTLSEGLRELAPQVYTMTFWRDSLKSLPTWITEFKYLSALDISENQIKEVPDGLALLPFFQLELFDNDLESLPEDFCQLGKYDFDVISNHLCNVSAWPSCYSADSIQREIESQDCP